MRPYGLLLRLLALPLALLGGVLAAALALAWLAVDGEPLVARPTPVTPADIGRVYALLKNNRPGLSEPGKLRAVWLNERDLELLLAEGGRRANTELRPQVRLTPRSAQVDLSLALPANPLGRWLNLQATLAQSQAQALPELQRLRLGALPVPEAVALWAVDRLLKSRRLEAQSALALRAVRRVGFLPQQAVLTYEVPQQGVVRQALADALLSPQEQQRVRLYVLRIGTLAAARPPRGAPRGVLPLSQVLPPLLQLAQQRAEMDSALHGSLQEETRAALLALTLTANPGALAKLLPASQRWGAQPRFKLTLRGREDFPLHFLVSSVIAAEGGGPLADAVGVYKELIDSQGGSGFSFNDIAADRAGTRFGLLAVQAPALLQQRVLRSGQPALRDEDLLPPVDDLPEFLTMAQFRQRYGGVDAPAYREMLADIERRLDTLPLLAPAGR